MKPAQINVDIIWGDLYLDVQTTFNIGTDVWRLLSYTGINEDGVLVGTITDGDPEVSRHDLDSFEHTSDIPPELVDLFKDLTEKAHDRIILARLQGARP